MLGQFFAQSLITKKRNRKKKNLDTQFRSSPNLSLSSHQTKTPWKINMEHNSLEVWFRSFSFLNGWLVSSKLIFQGVPSHFPKWGWK